VQAGSTKFDRVRWDRFPLINQTPSMRTWLRIQSNLGLSPNTIEAYGRALEDYLRFSHGCNTHPDSVTREHIAAYIRDLSSRDSRREKNMRIANSGAGLSNATLQQKGDRPSALL
jgi:integrase/recombinase XerD